jgi:putative Mn2+ efflux pump MntP
MDMDGLELLATALAVSLDALAAAAATGAMLNGVKLRQALKVGACFGLFQAVMPAIGLMAGLGLRSCLLMLDHWAAFGLLIITGSRMIWEELRDCPEAECPANPIGMSRLLLLGLATSMDALAVGVSLAVSGEYAVQHGLVIGLTTFALCTPGVLLGAKLKGLLRHRAGVAGGVILIIIGLKILIEHLMEGM